jgi:methyl-accepting chemotaxis protein
MRWMKIRASIRWKFMIIMVVVLLLSTAIGTLVIVNNQRATLRRGLVEEGNSLAAFIAKLSWEPIITGDTTPLDGYVADINRQPSVLYAVVQDVNDGYLTSPSVSVNLSSPGAEAVLGGLPKDSGLKDQIEALREKLPTTVVSQPIVMGEKKLGRITLGMSELDLRAQTAKTAVFVVMVNLVVALLLGLVIYVATQRIIIKPLGTMVVVSAAIAEGDLRRTVKVTSSDEVGVMGSAVNNMVSSLRGMIAGSTDAFGSVSVISEDLAGITRQVSGGSETQQVSIESASRAVEEMNQLIQEVNRSVDKLFTGAESSSSSATEMAASVGQVAGSAESMAALAESVSSAIVEMSATIQQVNRNIADLLLQVEQSSAATARIENSVQQIEKSADAALQVSEKVAASIAGEARDSVNRTVEGFTRIQTMVKDATKTMEILNTRAQAIGNIVVLIDEISDQTNLLALNASILAAQAGEKGRGFAVVAEEIRGLAMRTTGSTKEIDTQIRGVQEESKKAVAVMKDGSSMVTEGVSLVQSLSVLLERINESSARASEASRAIAGATREQVRETSRISTGMNQAADKAREITQATKEQATTSTQIVQLVTQMRDQAEQVRRSTVEQAGGTRALADASRLSREMAQGILKATQEEVVKNRAIVAAIGKVSDVARQNAAVVQHLEGCIATLSAQSEKLKVEIGKFSV